MLRADFTRNFHGKIAGLEAIDYERRLGYPGPDQLDAFRAVAPRDRARTATSMVPEVEHLLARTTLPFVSALQGPVTQAFRIDPAPTYADKGKLAWALVPFINAELKAAVAAGATLIQLDEPAFWIMPGGLPEMVDITNACLEGVDATTSLHLCFGNFRGRPATSYRSYAAFAPYFEDLQLDALSLEFANRSMWETELWAGVRWRQDPGRGHHRREGARPGDAGDRGLARAQAAGVVRAGQALAVGRLRLLPDRALPRGPEDALARGRREDRAQGARRRVARRESRRGGGGALPSVGRLGLPGSPRDHRAARGRAQAHTAALHARPRAVPSCHFHIWGAPVVCSSCGAPNEAGRKFCGECGTRLVAPCPSCGAANPPVARFCGECGSALSAPSLAACCRHLADRRLPVRSAFPRLDRRARAGRGAAPRVDPVRGPAWASRRSRKAATRRTRGSCCRSYFDIAKAVIGRYGGTIEKFIGDAVMAVWGAPIAHEDDAERAVRAALELVDAVRALGPGIAARLGVLTGEAAVTIGATDQGMVAGDLVNTASRLQSAAAPGTVLVGEATQRAASAAIAFEPAGEQTLKGKASPVPAWRALRVVGGSGGRGRADIQEAPFVGRDDELRLLKDLYHATTREQRARLVSVVGPGGHRQDAPRLGVQQVHRRRRRGASGGTPAAPRRTARASASGPWARWSVAGRASRRPTTRRPPGAHRGDGRGARA